MKNWKSNDEKKGAILPLYIFKRLSVIRLNSRTGKIRRILSSNWLARDFPRLFRKKKFSSGHEINPSFLVWVHKNAKIRSKKAQEGKKRALGFAYFWKGKIRTSRAGSP